MVRQIGRILSDPTAHESRHHGSQPPASTGVVVLVLVVLTVVVVIVIVIAITKNEAPKKFRIGTKGIDL